MAAKGPKMSLVFGRSNQLSLNKFFDPSTHSMRKGCDGEKRKEKRIVKIAVHYHCASQPPEQRPTGTPTTRANWVSIS